MRLEIKCNQLCPIVNHIYTKLIPKNHRSSEEKPRKALKTPDLGAKPQVWHHWPNHFESMEKVTQLTKQVNVM